MVVVSGTKIAQEISSTRSEVWRLIQQLRRWEWTWRGIRRAGINCDQYRICSYLRSCSLCSAGPIFGSNIRHYFKIGSTNTAAMVAAAEGAPQGSIFLAEEADGRTGTRIELLGIGALDRNLLFGDSSSTAASVGRTCDLAGGGTGGASGDSAGRSERRSRSEMAQRSR